MKHSFLKWIVACVLCSFLIAGCSPAVNDPAEMYKDENASIIFHKGQEALKDKNYGEAIKRYEALDAQYPSSPDLQTSQLNIIYAYYMNTDYASAEAAADRYIHTYPASAHDDYAYYMRGLSNYYQNMGVLEHIFAIDLAKRDLTQIKKSFADFSELVHRYPNSYYAPAAHQYMVYIRNVLADYELRAARYYYRRGAYVAAADRANIVVRHYQGAPAVKEALMIMIHSYHELHMTQLEQDTMKVYQANFGVIKNE